MTRVCVFGASGYAGQELIQRLRRHPGVQEVRAMSARTDQEPGDRVEGVPVEPFAPQNLAGTDIVFTCLPHGLAATVALAALDAGARVIDLSADFRLADAETYSRTYGADHPAPELLTEAVYGLTEYARPALGAARLVANPGCYPTSILLALRPLIEGELLDSTAPIIADAKSGVSGAGRGLNEATHFGNVHDNFQAYAVGTHRHVPEIHQHAACDRIVFVPHLLPVFRGILSTIYLTPAGGVRADEVRACLAERYAEEPFVQVLASGTPSLHDVQHTNECHLAVAAAGGQVVVLSAIDNLVKGAAGQALQNMNVLLGRAEGEGLR